MFLVLQVPVGDWFWFQTVALPVLGMGMGAFVMFGIYRTVNRHLERRHERVMAETARGSSVTELEDVNARLEMLEEVAERVHELEERIDFTERMLAQQQRQRIEGGHGS